MLTSKEKITKKFLYQIYFTHLYVCGNNYRLRDKNGCIVTLI